MVDERQEGLVVQVATLMQQIRSVEASVEDNKRSVRPVADLDRRLAEIAVRAETVREDVGLLRSRSRADERSRGELAGAIVEVDRKVDAMKNKATGAMWVLGVCLGVVQTFLIASIAWVFTHINEGYALNKLQQHRIDLLEQAIGRGEKQ